MTRGMVDLANWAVRLPDEVDPGLCCALCSIKGRTEWARILLQPEGDGAWEQGISVCDRCARELVLDPGLAGQARLALAVAVIRGIES